MGARLYTVWTEAQIALVERLHGNMPVQEIARQLATSERTTRRRIWDMQRTGRLPRLYSTKIGRGEAVVKARLNPLLPWCAATALRLHREGKTDAQIARHFGRDRNDVVQRMDLLIGLGHGAEKTPPVQRNCLSCREPFDRAHAGNFICYTCKRTDAFQCDAGYGVIRGLRVGA